MERLLNEQEVRVLGCLMEKAMATPDYYPLSLNALTNACNQKSNRDPVVSWNESIVQEAVEGLEKLDIANRSTVGRVPKYEETFTRRGNMVATEAAVLCVLLLRGPQTPGAIRSRSERLYAFDSLEALQETLDQLCDWGHARRLERLPGHKESRYMHLLGNIAENEDDTPEATDTIPVAGAADRLERLEAEVVSLRNELTDLKAVFDSFRKQFE